MACEIIERIMGGVMMRSFTRTLSLRISVGCGFSVAKAIAASTSIIKLIQRSWTMLKGGWPRMTVVESTKTMQERFTVSWNWMNFRTLS